MSLSNKITFKSLIFLIITFLIIAGGYFGYSKYIKQRHLALLDCPDCNVVVIMIDTMRADHLPTYGYKRNTAPFFKAFLDKSVVFEKAFSASSWTAPATASVFTSLYPSQHRVISGFLATKKMIKDGQAIEMNSIPPEYVTLGEMMKKAGYQTLGVADNLNIGKEMGFDRGFDQFEKFGEKGVEKVNRSASQFIDGVKDKGPYFAYLHYMDPHAPYLNLNPFYSNCIKGTDQSEEQKSICAYDSEIFNMDANIKKMFVKYGWMENSIVFVVADHGEELWDHGDRGHGKTLYSELLHVPFAVYHPKWKGKRIPHNVHTIDLLPTLAAFLGKETNPVWEGQNLIPYNDDSFEYQNRFLYSERLRTPYGKIKWWKRSVISKDWHYILTEEPDVPKVEELFNLTQDFAEKKNVASTNAALLADLNSKFSALPSPDIAQSKDAVKIEVDKELVDQLKTLGYLD